MSNKSKQETQPLLLERDEAILIYYALMRAEGELQDEKPGEETGTELREVRTIIEKLRELFTQYPGEGPGPIIRKG